MSGDFPPPTPPSGPPSGFPTFGPPTTPPPPRQPSGPTHDSFAGRPEVLDSGAGGAWLPPQPPGSGSSGRRKGLIAGGALVGLAALAGGGFFAYSMLFASGSQPSEALPDSTVAYLSVDLDPSGKQKLEALDTLSKFPAFAANSGIESTDDLREKLFEALQDDGVCADLNFADDVAPWLGDRVAVAAVDLGQKDDQSDDQNGLPVTPVVVLQIKDEAKAEAGLEALRSCGAAEAGSVAEDSSIVEDPGSDDAQSDDFGGWSIQGDWVVLAETEDLAKQVTDAAGDAPLSDDGTYNDWIDAAGDEGIITGYVSPDAAGLISDGFADFGGTGGSITCSEIAPPPMPSLGSDPFGEDPFEPDCTEELSPLPAPEMQQQVDDALKGFKGLAVKVRFDDGALEVESAGSTIYPGLEGLGSSDRGDDVLATLPADTAAAVGFGFEPGWVDSLTEYFSSSLAASGFGSVDEMIDQAEAETGLSIPDDIETLFGESAAVSFGSDFDTDNLETEGRANVPLGVKIEGDADAIKAVLDKILSNPDVPAEVSDLVGYDSEGNYVAGGPSPDYRKQLLQDGDLGAEQTYRDVVPESKIASSVLYVNFDANDWLVKLVDAFQPDKEVTDNLEPLAALGFSTWTDGDGSHGLLKITTN